MIILIFHEAGESAFFAVSSLVLKASKESQYKSFRLLHFSPGRRKRLPGTKRCFFKKQTVYIRRKIKWKYCLPWTFFARILHQVQLEVGYKANNWVVKVHCNRDISIIDIYFPALQCRNMNCWKSFLCRKMSLWPQLLP